MNKILIGIILSSSLIAFNAEVKKSSVTLSINDQEKIVESGENFLLNPGDIVCFIGGEGRVVIIGDNYRKQLSKRNKSCKHLPGISGESDGYSQLLNNQVVSMFKNTKEKSVSGTSRKILTSETFTEPISLSSQMKYLSIENNTWGPLPITLEILDKKGTVVETMSNEEDVLTSFIIQKNMLKNGYTIKIFNAFGDILVNSKIHL